MSKTGGINKLPLAKRVQILAMLCEGSSMRSVSCVCDVSINTVTKLLEDAGLACAAFHDKAARNVKVRHVQADEIWGFCAAKQKNVPSMKAPVEICGSRRQKLHVDFDALPRHAVCDRDLRLSLIDDVRHGACRRGSSLRGTG